MIRYALLLACASLGACTFQLGIVRPQASRNADQQQLDTLACKDQANLAASSTGRQTGNFLLGLTIIGTPLAYHLDKVKQRQVFADCMHERGYTVDAPT